MLESPTHYYFTGTGNSRCIALQMAERLGGSAISIPDVMEQPSVRTDADTVVIVFPSYLAGLRGVPLIVERFLGKLDDEQSKRVFAMGDPLERRELNGRPQIVRFAE